MADENLKKMMRDYAESSEPKHTELDEIENRMEEMDPDQRDQAAEEFAEILRSQGGEHHKHHILSKAAGIVVSGSMQAIIAHLVAKKLDEKGERPSWRDEFIGGLSGGTMTEFGPEMLEKLKHAL